LLIEQIIQYFSPKINLQTFDGFSVTTNYQRILALKEFLVMKTFKQTTITSLQIIQMENEKHDVFQQWSPSILDTLLAS